MPKPLSPCGTIGAYQRHLKAGQEACAACKEARAAYTRDRREGRIKARRPAQCGTLRGYYSHRHHKTQACRACLDAYAAYTGARRARLRAERAERAAALEAAWAEVLAETGGA